MTKEHIKNLIIRRYLDEARVITTQRKGVKVEDVLYFTDWIRNESNKVIYYYEDVYDDTHKDGELDYDVVVKPIKEKLSKQPNLEKLEYMIDAIDFSLNFTNED
jgi:hypothetical protein